MPDARRGRSWLYERPTVPTQAERDLDLRDAIERVVLEFPGYGYRRVTKALGRAGWEVNHKRVLRMMRQESLLCQLQCHFVVTADSRHDHAVYPNLLADHELTGLNQAWQADLTYVRLPTPFVYRAAILDAFSRRVVGWALSRTIDTRFTLVALEMALERRAPQPGFIHHSDRGVQYASADYVARLVEAGARISMSAKGNPYDKPHVERAISYVRERFFKGGTFASLADLREQADRWGREVAGLRVHGTTRKVPLVVFRDEEQRHLLPLGDETFDVPQWRALTVHPDHHVEFGAALYSVPSTACPPGSRVEVRGDRQIVKIYHRGTLVKEHLRVGRGQRVTDPTDYPAEKTAYALRAPDRLRKTAADLGPSIGAFADRLLDGPLP